MNSTALALALALIATLAGCATPTPPAPAPSPEADPGEPAPERRLFPCGSTTRFSSGVILTVKCVPMPGVWI